MDPLVIVLRLIHVVAGALWVGMVTFVTYFLQPALQEAGPEGGKVMAAVQRRSIMTVMPILAVSTLADNYTQESTQVFCLALFNQTSIEPKVFRCADRHPDKIRMRGIEEEAALVGNNHARNTEHWPGF